MSKDVPIFKRNSYIGAEKREDAVIKNKNGKKINYKTNRRPSSYRKNKPQSQGKIRRREHEKSSVRCKVEHVFGVIKGQFGYRKTRYRGLRIQTGKLNIMFALAMKNRTVPDLSTIKPLPSWLRCVARRCFKYKNLENHQKP